ncbi:hypothetical protein, partial [Aeromonas sp. PI_26]|uniref:hypothetical protein n=1 Tax=Aeromonas sp. PI_26 TaxID=2899138 RepID=UPI0022EAD2ED
MAKSKPVKMASNPSDKGLIWIRNGGDDRVLVLFLQVKTKYCLFNTLKAPKPSRQTGLCVGSGVQICGSYE